LIGDEEVRDDGTNDQYYSSGADPQPRRFEHALVIDRWMQRWATDRTVCRGHRQGDKAMRALRSPELSDGIAMGIAQLSIAKQGGGNRHVAKFEHDFTPDEAALFSVLSLFPSTTHDKILRHADWIAHARTDSPRPSATGHRDPKPLRMVSPELLRLEKRCTKSRGEVAVDFGSWVEREQSLIRCPSFIHPSERCCRHAEQAIDSDQPLSTVAARFERCLSEAKSALEVHSSIGVLGLCKLIADGTRLRIGNRRENKRKDEPRRRPSHKHPCSHFWFAEQVLPDPAGNRAL